MVSSLARQKEAGKGEAEILVIVKPSRKVKFSVWFG